MLHEIAEDLLIERSIYVIDRDRYTCAGGIAPMDMMLAIIGADHGRRLARAVSEWFIPHLGARFIPAPAFWLG